MRRVLVMGVALLALAACQKKVESTAAVGEAPAASATASAVSPPKRKPGLWAQTISTNGMTQTMKLCLDEATEAKMTVWGQQAGKDICAKNTVTPAPGGWTFVSECDMGQAGKVATTGKATGDFNSKYVIKATSVTTGSTMAQANGTHEMEMTGTWEGACPANMKPGDMTLPNGMTMNIGSVTGK
ncbi:DUF3617 family protein [Phenylobacterium sp.]|uniref:DUF3617 domain-containing protein n=1 Tax=Phenylobacterium sp. TaxID=1871053 RepID=UPI00286D9306|nr:DUF3617 family protein [Phenylobacterium sp.]